MRRKNLQEIRAGNEARPPDFGDTFHGNVQTRFRIFAAKEPKDFESAFLPHPLPDAEADTWPWSEQWFEIVNRKQAWQRPPLALKEEIENVLLPTARTSVRTQCRLKGWRRRRA